MEILLYTGLPPHEKVRLHEYLFIGNTGSSVLGQVNEP
jgi:hypothetical protein